MKVLDYYKNYLNEDVVKVETIYFSMNLTDDTSGTEFYDKVTHLNGNVDYYISTFIPGHSLVSYEIPNEWFKYAVVSLCSNEEIPNDCIDNVYRGVGY